MITPYEAYVAVAEQLNRAHPGRPREALGAVQLRRRGRRERGQDRPARTPAGTAVVVVRPRLPRPHQPHDGADRQGDAVQAAASARSPARSTARRCRTRSATDGTDRRGRGGQRAIDDASRSRSAPTNLAAVHHRADPGRGRLHRAGARVPARAARRGAASNGVVFIADEVQTGFARTGAMVRLRARGRRTRT